MAHKLHHNLIHWLKHSKDLGHNDFRVLWLYTDGHTPKPDKETRNKEREKHNIVREHIRIHCKNNNNICS